METDPTRRRLLAASALAAAGLVLDDAFAEPLAPTPQAQPPQAQPPQAQPSQTARVRDLYDPEIFNEWAHPNRGAQQVAQGGPR